MRPAARTLTFFLLAACLLTLLFLAHRRNHTLSFSISHPEKVTTIRMNDDSTTLMLEKKDAGWRANEKFPVRKEAIRFLLYTLEKIEVKTTLSGKVLQAALEDSTLRRTRVRIYRGPFRIRSFYFCTTNHAPPVNMLNPQGSSHYVTPYLPGEETLDFYPFTTNLYYWRSHEIFHFLPGEVQKVTLRHYDHPGQDFETGRDPDGHYFFKLLTAPAENMRVDTARIMRYLSYFQELSFDDFARNLTTAKIDGVYQQNPQYHLEVIADHGDTIQIKTIPKLRVDSSGLSDRVPDPDLTWAYVKPLDALVIIKYYRIDPFIKEPAYFYRK